MHDVPNWTDLNPRLGASYDLFGNGQTALKVSLGRYVFPETTVLTAAVNPIITVLGMGGWMVGLVALTAGSLLCGP